ncbi:phenylalanine--tRNA ligase subunit alpha [Haloterrigena sp. SYSU A558-1]|uniref:phenylalanine--tRNA ligase n=1 Tax=Haloterrigena gelatinilytica TaxID=2741724 RepID=A0A8J8GID4_9EURY|nr:phenylalanine--tRNA ligase subunit alpha [Haloterrigena gelatinilytica]NUB89928.1 phenylalanine--tRNA ligase subunit alpha [Haloterrigena gelatinilytica]NUC74246.1 phenylalanine--tRNA ligase subunit alpha [Haloterrigena gelatinilytica]
MQLPAQQVAVLEAASADEATSVDALAERADLPPETVTGAAFELEDEGLVEIEERVDETVALTEEGADYASDELPEIALYEAALEAGADEEAVQMGRVIGASGLEGTGVDIALSNYARKGYGTIDSGEITADADADPSADAEANALETLSGADEAAVDSVAVDSETLDQLERRGLLERRESTVREIRLTDRAVTELMAGIETAETVGQVTPELLTSWAKQRFADHSSGQGPREDGDWEDVEFAEYNVEADAEEIESGTVHVLRQMSERVKDVLVGMGFQEMDGPHVDADFWINDCLFMPQDHPARTHWDRFAMEQPSHIDELPEDLVADVERVHREGLGEDSEGYHSPWDEEFARALALRGHTTSLSTRYLSGTQIGEIEPPARFFSVEKAYRNDTLDATHLLEFYQIEGWVMAEDLSVRDLMGTFEEFYAQFGIEDIQFKPHYNPYTEPSFELFGTHPTTGELIEIGNSGIFREEMLEPLGVDCDVMAWGLALERLAMLTTGAEDIRDLHGTLADLEFLRNAEVTY